MSPQRKLTCVIALYAVGYLCCRIFAFDQPILNYCSSLLVVVLPFLAIGPLLKLSKWTKRAGLVLLSPILFMELVFMLFFFACGSPELHHYRPGSCIQEEQRLERNGYTVHLLSDCGGGATVRNSEWIEQRRRLMPGLSLVKTIASFYGAANGDLAFGDGNTLRYLRSEVDDNGKQDYTYQLKPHLYF